jgi:hypothetical protein
MTYVRMVYDNPYKTPEQKRERARRLLTLADLNENASRRDREEAARFLKLADEQEAKAREAGDGHGAAVSK